MRKLKRTTCIILALLFVMPVIAMAGEWRDKTTGAAAVSKTITFTKAAKLKEVRVHLSAAGAAGDLTITMDSSLGAAYDTVLLTQDMTSVVNYQWRPDSDLFLQSGDAIVTAWANASTRTYGIEFIFEDVQ